MIEEKVKVVETAGRNPEKVIKKCKACHATVGLCLAAGSWYVRHPQVCCGETRHDCCKDGSGPRLLVIDPMAIEAQT